MRYIKVIEAGLQTTIQDSGRGGFQSLGIPKSGAMDIWNMYLSNILVGKNKNSPVIETTYVSCKLEFLNDMTIAITGADMKALVNGNTVNNYESILVKAGDVLSFKGLKTGLRSYISFSGNIKCDEYFNSSSTYLKYNFGGYDGRMFKSGDIIEVDDVENNSNFIVEPVFEYDNIIRFIPTYEYTEEVISEFLNNNYKVSNDSDRMGMKLEGSGLVSLSTSDIISSPIVPGTIQVPRNGKPIIMLKDAQTIGGYTRIGCVIPSDLAKLAQLKANDDIYFRKIDVEESRLIRHTLEMKIESLVNELINNKDQRRFRIVVNNKLYNIGVEEK